jgi:uncharacterized protein (TIGR02231 family)
MAVVYPDRARLTRSGSLSLERGVHSLEIGNLPLELDVASLRSTARGTARGRLLGVQAKKVFYTDTPAEAVRELEAQMEAVQTEIKGVETKQEVIKNSRISLNALLNHTDTYASALASGEMSLEIQRSLYADIRAQIEGLDGEAQKLSDKRKEFERLLEKLKNQINQLHGARPRQRYAASVEVEVLEAGELTVELDYVVSGASWKPLYDIRFSDRGSQAEIAVTYLAEVSQSTGEDWDNIALALSTARPALASTLPELNPWYIRPLPDRPVPVFSPARAMKTTPVQAVEAAVPPAAMAMPEFDTQELLAEQATVETSGAAVTYHVPGTCNLPADGQPHKVSVTDLPLQPRLDYVTAPKLVQAVYRRAKVLNDSPYTLLPGDANLFTEGEFIGTTRLELIAPQAEIELYLGVDDRVKVERELKRREVEKTLIGGKRRLHYGYEITLENLLTSEAKVTLYDQIPVARHEEIKVRLEGTDPKPAGQSELNQLEWTFNLASKEKRAVRFDFVVEYPQGMEVIGLP